MQRVGMLTTDTANFNHQAGFFYLARIHCRKLIFAVLGWILYRLVNDLWFSLFMDMTLGMRVLYWCYAALELAAIVGIVAAFWSKNPYFLIPAFLCLVRSMHTFAAISSCGAFTCLKLSSPLCKFSQSKMLSTLKVFIT
ncbi:unnamed protein product [Anisakis simplex]|uniref:7TM_GPCR_Srx domain-containing protein n=1 Tax=Anisakis simplex TaxID=6269 RepID=A0A0M3KDN0_ANISI|nr:unnamed protein product [Anisakis simplex]